jgi:hypothetical protein
VVFIDANVEMASQILGGIMKFKIGDKVRFKVTEEEWKSYFIRKNITCDIDRTDIIDLANRYKDLLGEIITISIIENDYIYIPINDNDYHIQGFNDDWFLPYEEKSEDVIDENGFKMNPKNWENGLGLL